MLYEETLSLFIIRLYFICRIKMFCYSLFPTAHQTTQTPDQTFNRLIKSASEVSCSFWCSEFFSRFLFFCCKSLAGFISWGNRITTVITVCWKTDFCLYVYLQVVDWRASPENSCKRDVSGECCGETWVGRRLQRPGGVGTLQNINQRGQILEFYLFLCSNPCRLGWIIVQRCRADLSLVPYRMYCAS